MDITPLIAKNAQVIQGYGADGIRVSGVLYEGGAIVTTSICYPLSFSTKDIQQLTLADFVFLEALDFKPDVLLLGTGTSIAFLPKELKQALKARYDIIPDVMGTGAACRTYNVLLSEGRHICAALLPL